MPADTLKNYDGFDTTEVDKWIGKEIIFAEFYEPCSATDIRRWVQAMDYANPIHWNQEFAESSKFGGIVAPQSFIIAMDYGHGCHPACVGTIPGSHIIFGGEEWWYYGTPVRPGDKLTQKRRYDGHTVTDTKFAGPTLFGRGDTVHRNQHGALVAKERATAIRYLRDEANKRATYSKERGIKSWTKKEIEDIYAQRLQWILSNREGKSPKYQDVKVGDKLPRRVIGPHSRISFALECRSFPQNIWGTWRWMNPPPGLVDPAKIPGGFADDMTYDFEARKIDPRQGDGLFYGPSSGHINPEKGEAVGMGGAYGYGASMNAWHTDTIAYWAGHEGYVWHSKTQFRAPAFEGDVTYVDAEIADKIDQSPYGMPVVQVALKMTTQNGDTILTGKAEVELPY